MGAAPSSYLLGFHIAVEFLAGTFLFWNGTADFDPEEARKRTGRAKLWKRWHASGLLAIGYVGYIGFSMPEFKIEACKACGLFHMLASVASMLAFSDGTVGANQAFLHNPHLYLGVGFAAVAFGVLN